MKDLRLHISRLHVADANADVFSPSSLTILTLLIALSLLPNKITFRHGIGHVYIVVLLCELCTWSYALCLFTDWA